MLTEALNVQGQPTRIVYDGFGRLLQMYAPHPTTTDAISPNPSVEIEYFLPPDSGTAHSLIHTKAQDGASISDVTYLESWAYVDGLGRTITTLSEDEVVSVESGNQTQSVQRWIVGAMQEWDAKSAVRRKYLEFYYTGDPQSFDFGDYPGTYYGRQRYDAFGRQLQTYDLDGTVTLRSKYHALSSEAWDAADLEAGPHQSTYLTTVKDGHGRAAQSIERFKEDTTLVERSTETQFLPTGEPEVITRRKLSGGAPVGGASTSRWFAWDTLGRMVLNVEPNTSSSYAHNATPNAASTHETTYTNITAWRYQYNLAGDLIGMSDARGCGANFYFDGVGRLLAEDYFPCASTDQALYSAPTADTLPSGDKLPASSSAGIEVLYTYDAYVPPAQSGLAFDTAACDPSNGVTAPVQFSRGRLVRVSDLGAESYTVYDGRGRNTCATTRLTKPYAPTSTVAVPTFANRYAPRWYSKQFTYDAADRVVDETTGARVLLGNVNQSFVKTIYGPRGTVKKVESSYGDGKLINAIDRTADGLVTRIEYGDLPHTATTYTFDDRRRVHTAVTARAPPSQWPADFETNTNGSYPLLLQDETFTYDVVGNPVTITDNRIQEEWPAGTKPVSRSFAYDDLYRVIKADYQYAAGDDTWKSPFEAELADATGAGDPRRAEPSPHVSFAKRILWQSYQYDWLGNTKTSNDDAKGFYDRSLGAITNGTTKAYQLTGATNGNLTSPANSPPTGSLSTTYDPAGNLTQLQVTRNGTCAGSSNPGCHQSFLYTWDEVGRLVRARRWDQATVPANPTTTAPVVDLQYHYAAGDSRVLKTARSGSQEVHTAYIFPSLELRRAQFNTATAGDYTLTSTTEVGYLFANGVRLARLAQQPLDSAGDSNLLRVFFELGDHLGSTSVVLDKGTGELVERDTYQVYGGAESSYRPSTWSSFREDYRFTGKEEDVEVGLTYFGKRFYNALLQRWLSPDPLEVHQPGQADANLYAYVSGAALKNIDPLGLDGVEDEAGQQSIDPIQSDATSSPESLQSDAGQTTAAEPEAAPAPTERSTEAQVTSYPDALRNDIDKARARCTNGLCSGVGAVVGLVGDVMAFPGDVVNIVNSSVRATEAAERGEYGEAAVEGLRVLGAAAFIGQTARTFTQAIPKVAPPVRTSPTPSPVCTGANCGGVAVCFTSGTLVQTPDGPRPIESLRLGDRVLTTDSDNGTTAVDATWLVVTLRMPNPYAAHDIIEVRLLRSPSWLDANGAFIGAQLHLAMHEMGLEGSATVVSIENAPPVEEGHGKVVLGTVTHVNNDVRQLHFENSDVVVQPTGTHRFYSLDRQSWIAAGELLKGERLRTESGELVLRDLTGLVGGYRVFNIEVETDHEYFVSNARLLTHNNDCAGPVRITGDALKAARNEFNSVKPKFWRNEASTSPDNWSPENLARMNAGKAPIGSDGFPMELHHTQPLAEGGSNSFANLKALTRTDHRLGDNYKLNHPNLP